MDHASAQPDSVHLVGSIGLDNVEDVFRVVGKMLGRRLKRIPDGEPGSRRLWVSFQYPMLRSSPFLRPDPSGAVRATNKFPLLCMAEGVQPSEVHFGELGYTREARASYLDFCAARQRGEIPARLRFQVCLPTPMGVSYAFCTARDVVAIDAAYQAAMIREVQALCRAIPHHDLCVQWDFCHEMLMLDGQPQDMFPMVKGSMDEIMNRMGAICAPVPSDVELGFHLCYGDFGAKHFLEPRDAGRMVDVCNALAKTVSHPIAYIHMPVPMTRNDDAYFRPFESLRLSPETEIYLGLIHLADGVEGARQRIATARKFVNEFGVATECGIARARTSRLVENVLQVYAETAREPAP
jgi:hypothetical protein